MISKFVLLKESKVAIALYYTFVTGFMEPIQSHIGSNEIIDYKDFKAL